MIKYLLLSIIAVLIQVNLSYAQQHKFVTPLHKFLQANADSTIIFQYDYSWLHTPEYFILSKKSDTLTVYTYKILNKINPKIILPRNMLYKLHQRNAVDIYKTPVDINLYFNPKYMAKDNLDKFWKSVVALSPWQIQDDSVTGPDCPVDSNRKDQKNIYDGGGIILFLITKDEIKRLYYYAPDFYVKICPERGDRKNILAIRDIFSAYFKNDE